MRTLTVLLAQAFYLNKVLKLLAKRIGKMGKQARISPTFDTAKF
jgi:hypothetical protein